MSERPFMQLYVSDYLGDTRHLSCEQHGAYLLLLMTMWNAGGSLPDDDTKLARIVCLSVKKWRAIRDDILAFFEVRDGTISHNRMTKELQKSERKSESRASAGARGGVAKALKDNDAGLAIATGLPWHLPDTITREEESPHTPLTGGDEVFEREVWQVFPRHLNSTRSDAKVQYDRLTPDQQVACRLGALAYRAEHDRATAAGKAAIPKKLSTWIAKRGWEGLAPAPSTTGVIVIRPDEADFEMVLSERPGLLLSKAGNITIAADELETIRRSAAGKARAAA